MYENVMRNVKWWDLAIIAGFAIVFIFEMIGTHYSDAFGSLVTAFLYAQAVYWAREAREQRRRVSVLLKLAGAK